MDISLVSSDEWCKGNIPNSGRRRVRLGSGAYPALFLAIHVAAILAALTGALYPCEAPARYLATFGRG